jgi:hypothetical protein
MLKNQRISELASTQNFFSQKLAKLFMKLSGKYSKD